MSCKNCIKCNKRQWGFPVRWDRKGKVVEINLYLYEQVELARHNIKQMSK